MNEEEAPTLSLWMRRSGSFRTSGDPHVSVRTSLVWPVSPVLPAFEPSLAWRAGSFRATLSVHGFRLRCCAPGFGLHCFGPDGCAPRYSVSRYSWFVELCFQRDCFQHAPPDDRCARRFARARYAQARSDCRPRPGLHEETSSARDTPRQPHETSLRRVPRTPPDGPWPQSPDAHDSLARIILGSGWPDRKSTRLNSSHL